MLEPFLGRSELAHHGHRVVDGQQLMQATSDFMLGWIRVKDISGLERDYYVRQFWDQMGSAVVDVAPPNTMDVYAQICAKTLARAHARSGDAIAIPSYLGTSDAFDRALARFAELYADQNQRDSTALKAAANTGRVSVKVG